MAVKFKPIIFPLVIVILCLAVVYLALLRTSREPVKEKGEKQEAEKIVLEQVKEPKPLPLKIEEVTTVSPTKVIIPAGPKALPFKGKVVDKISLASIANAKVSYYPNYDFAYLDILPVEIKYTDEEGEFIINVFETFALVITIEKENYATQLYRYPFPDSRVNLIEQPFIFFLEPQAGIEGVVVNVAAEPVANAQISVACRIREEGGLVSSIAACVTDEKGRFQLTGLKSGVYDLVVIARGYKNKAVSSVPTGTEGLRIVLEPGGSTIEGRAIKELSGEPWAKGRLFLRAEPYFYLCTITDENGEFQFSGLSAGSYLLEVEIGQTMYPAQRLEIPAQDQHIKDIEVVIPEPIMVKGKLLEKATQQPIPAAEVGCYYYKAEKVTAITDEKGEFAFNTIVVRKNWLWLNITAPGFTLSARKGPGVKRISESSIGIDTKSKVVVSDIIIYMERVKGVVIKGKVLSPQEQAVANARVVGSIKYGPLAIEHFDSQLTDSNGEFLFHSKGGAEAFVSLYASKSNLGTIAKEDILIKPAEREKFVELRFKSPGGISGKIIDEYENPVEDACVVLQPQAVKRWDLYRRLAVTNGRGEFKLAGITPGVYELQVWAEEFVPTVLKELTISEGVETKDLIIKLSHGHFIAGTVSDPEGNPVIGAEVESRFRVPNRPFEKVAYTDDGGNYRMEGLPETVEEINARHDNFRSAEIDNPPIDSTEVNIVLTPLARLRGRVIYAREQRPVESFALSMARREGEKLTVLGGLYYFANPKGEFEVLYGLWTGNQLLARSSDGYLGVSEIIETMAEIPESRYMVIEVHEPATIKGVVKDKYTQQPVAEATVGLPSMHIGLWLKQVINYKDETNSLGEFEIREILPGKQIIRVSHSMYTQAQEMSVELLPGEEKEVEIYLVTAGRIVGTALNYQGEPWAGLSIGLNSAKGYFPLAFIHGIKTDNQGSYVFEGLPADRYEVEARMGDQRLEEKSVTILEEEEKIVNFDFSDWVLVQGTVSDASGQPLRDAALYFRLPDFTKLHSADANPLGRFKILLQPSRYQVTASAEKKRYIFRDCIIPEVDVYELELTAANGRIYGQVVDAATQEPIEMCDIGLYPALEGIDQKQMQRSYFFGTATDEAGEFSINQLSPGRYKLSANAVHQGYLPVESDIIELQNEDDEQYIVLELKKGHEALLAPVNAETGQPLPEEVVEHLRVERIWDEKGNLIDKYRYERQGNKIKVFGLPAGKLRMELFDLEHFYIHEFCQLEAKPEESPECQVPMVKGGKLEVEHYPFALSSLFWPRRIKLLKPDGTVYFDSREDRMDGLGGFVTVIGGIEPDRYKLIFEHPDYSCEPVEFTINKAEITRVKLDLELIRPD